MSAAAGSVAVQDGRLDARRRPASRATTSERPEQDEPPECGPEDYVGGERDLVEPIASHIDFQNVGRVHHRHARVFAHEDEWPSGSDDAAPRLAAHHLRTGRHCRALAYEGRRERDEDAEEDRQERSRDRWESGPAPPCCAPPGHDSLPRLAALRGRARPKPAARASRPDRPKDRRPGACRRRCGSASSSCSVALRCESTASSMLATPAAAIRRSTGRNRRPGRRKPGHCRSGPACEVRDVASAATSAGCRRRPGSAGSASASSASYGRCSREAKALSAGRPGRGRRPQAVQALRPAPRCTTGLPANRFAEAWERVVRPRSANARRSRRPGRARVTPSSAPSGTGSFGRDHR